MSPTSNDLLELFENRLLDTSLPISFHMMEIYQEADDQDATFLFR